MKRQLHTFFVETLIVVCVSATLAQTPAVSGSTSAGAGWSRNDIFQNKVFIENKGQFDGKNSLTSHRIKYGINSGGQEIYFTTHGLTWRYTKSELPEEVLREIEEEKQGKKEEKPGELEREIAEKTKTTVYLVNMEWLGANSDAELMAANPVPEYYTYGDEKVFYKASAYKKLTYKNLYPSIDVEYVFHEKEGIKYSLILHPGADASKIKMKFSGTDKVYKDDAGNIHLVTALGDIVDHAPFTFYEADKSVIASTFFVNRNVVSFNLKNYNNSRTVIIDPWTVGVTMPASNKALEVEKDAVGNVYISGGSNVSGGVLIVQKFSLAGALQWTYTPIPNMCSTFNGYYGDDLKVDAQGNIYFDGGSSNCSPNGNKTIVKLTPAGSAVWVADILESEPYRLLVDCGVTTLYLTGSWSPRLHIISPATGLESNNVPIVYTANGTSSDDMRDVILAPNGNYYGISTAQPANNATIRIFNPAWSQLVNVPAGFNVTYWFASYTGHANAGQPASLHLVAASRQFFFVTDGATLQKRNLTTGALISSVAIPGGTSVTSASGNSGIVTDTCGNVYVGTQNSVRKYDSNLVFISSAATAAAVYDLCLGINGEILASGNGFLASVNLSACTPAALNVTATATPTGNCNNGNIGTSTATVTGGDPSYSYYWIPGGQTGSTVTGLGAGTYSVIVTDMNCNKDTAVVTVTSAGALTASVTQTNLQCNGTSNGTASVSASNGTAPYTYTWSTGSTAATVTGLGASTYTATITDANGCKVIIPLNITQPNATPVSFQTTPTTCNNRNGNAVANVTGASGPYTYLWSNGRTTYYAGSTLYSSELTGGIYTVTITDSKGCTLATTVTVPTSTSTVSTSFTYSALCANTPVNFTNTGTPPGTGITYNWVISPITPTNVSGTTTDFSYTFLTAGTYTVAHTVSDGTCSNTLSKTIVVVDCSAGPSITAAGTSVCPGSCATVTSSATGGTQPYTYSWNTGSTTQNINPCPTSTTTYTVKVTDGGGATATSTAVVTVNPAVTVTATSTNITCNGTATGSVTATPGGGTPAFNYVWSNGITTSTETNLAVGNYTVTVIDSKGCTAVSTTTITAPTALIGQYTKGTANCSNCGCKEWIMLNATGGTSPYSFTWPDGYDKRYKNALCPGIYNVIVTDNNGCKTTVKVNAP
ncbi:MAG: hypothetical protein IT235_05275 [Bacteroidia bacterium]|nr:hypothetical protein [Bacteroidia bacterium]